MKRLIGAVSRSFLLTVLFVSGAAQLSAQEKVMVTRFVIDSEWFESSFSNDDRKAIEDSVASLLAAKGEEYFPYLDWTPTGQAEGVTSPSLEVVLRQATEMVDDQFPCEVVHLVLIGDSPDVAAVGSMEELELYPLCALLPSTAADLLADITSTLTQKFDNASFQTSQLQEKLLSQIALADRDLIDVIDSSPKAVVVPLLWSEAIPFPPASTLQLRLISNAASLGQMQLRGAAPHENAFIRWEEPILLQIEDTRFPAGMIDQLKSYMETQPNVNVVAFMLTYAHGTRTGDREDVD